jgi:hypothetical protein
VVDELDVGHVDDDGPVVDSCRMRVRSRRSTVTLVGSYCPPRPMAPSDMYRSARASSVAAAKRKPRQVRPRPFRATEAGVGHPATGAQSGGEEGGQTAAELPDVVVHAARMAPWTTTRS